MRDLWMLVMQHWPRVDILAFDTGFDRFKARMKEAERRKEIYRCGTALSCCNREGLRIWSSAEAYQYRDVPAVM